MMRITELLKQESIGLNVSVSTKEEAIDKLVDLMAAGGRLKDKAGYKEGILAREALGSTGIGGGIAIPHAKVEAVKEPGLAAMVVPAGVDYEAFDGSLANILFMIAAPAEGADVHLEALSRLSTLLMNPDFMEGLLKAESKEAFLKVIDDAETAKFGAEEKKESEEKKEVAGYRVLAVTACPTGIAHTYMAAESLENMAKKLGVSIKVETDGSGGAQNVLTKAEIDSAEAIIVAADKNVGMARFNGKPVIQVPVADGIHKAEELINRAVSGSVPVYHHQEDGSESSASDEGKDSIGRTIYKHLMNGVSHMLPFVIGGGILIALAFLLDDYSINPANFGMNTPVAAFFKTVGNAAFGYMLPILAGFIAMSIADRPGLAVGFAGGVLAMNGTNFTDLAAGSTTGISGGFLAALLAGFAAGYIVQFLKKITEKLPASLNGIRPMLIYPLGGILIVGAMMCAVNPVMGMINTATTDWLNALGGSSKVLLGAIVAGMMSVDMGGPVNKAAYVFGTAALASGNYEVMAAVMVGGMVPPIAIALSTTFCPRKWTLDERRNGIVNYVMGLCFVSEGAIPYAAADPLRVLPSCVVGSAVAGALSMTFGCALRAPHGGIFVFPVVDHAALYCVALAVGSVLGAVILSLVKKTQPAEAK